MKNKNSGSATCPSDMALDAWVLGGRKDADPLAPHVKACQRCTARLAELDSAAEVFKREVFPVTVERVVERTRPLPWYRRLLAEDHPFKLVYSVPVLATVLILLAVGLVVSPFQQHENRGSGIKGSKGSTVSGALGLTVFVGHEGSVRELGDGETVFPGDRIRFKPAVPADGYLMVVSVEENGAVNRYYPPESDSAMKVAAGSEALPGSIVLDESTGAERVFVLFSEKPFAFGEVKTAVESTRRFGSIEGMKSIPLHLRQATIVFRKGAAK